jgi:hypothetical protein
MLSIALLSSAAFDFSNIEPTRFDISHLGNDDAAQWAFEYLEKSPIVVSFPLNRNEASGAPSESQPSFGLKIFPVEKSHLSHDQAKSMKQTWI